MVSFDDDFDAPSLGKVSPTACLGGRTHRPLCGCCGGSDGVRRALRKFNRHCDLEGSPRQWESKGDKPKRKDKHRNTNRKYSYLEALA